MPIDQICCFVCLVIQFIHLKKLNSQIEHIYITCYEVLYLDIDFIVTEIKYAFESFICFLKR
jgi:hypothetical protein